MLRVSMSPGSTAGNAKRGSREPIVHAIAPCMQRSLSLHVSPFFIERRRSCCCVNAIRGTTRKSRRVQESCLRRRTKRSCCSLECLQCFPFVKGGGAWVRPHLTSAAKLQAPTTNAPARMQSKRGETRRGCLPPHATQTSPAGAHRDSALAREHIVLSSDLGSNFLRLHLLDASGAQTFHDLDSASAP